jgi:hypothetical protein
MNSKILIFISLNIISGCAEHKPPFYGLTENSYGHLTTQKITECGLQNYPYVGSKDKEMILDLSSSITAAITTPIKGSLKIDQTILQEELQDNFKIPGDVGQPNVVLLKRSADEIIFWYSLGVVSFNEITNAANEFCGHHNKKALFRGSSKKCSAPIPLPFAVNHVQQQVQITNAISSFQCV